MSWFPPMSYCPPPVSSLLPSQHLYVTTAPHLLSRNGAQSTWKFPTPATRHIPPLVSVPLSVCLSLLLFLCPFSPLVAILGMHPCPCLPMGFLLSQSPPRLFAPASPSVCVRRLLASSSSWSLFLGVSFAWGQRAKAPPLPVNLSLWPLTPRHLATLTLLWYLHTPPPF